MNSKLVTTLIAGVMLIAGSLAQAEESRSMSVEDASAAFPEIVSGNIIEVFPLALSNFAGFDSLLVVSNLSQAVGNFEVCGLPVGATNFVCRGDTYDPLETKFIDLPTIGLTNSAGQVQVRSIGGTIGGAGLILYSLNQGGISYVQPLSFQVN
jgi:hypothetical protein